MILDNLASGGSTKICGRPSNIGPNLFDRLHVLQKESRFLRCSVRAPIVIQFFGVVYLFVVYEVNLLRLVTDVRNDWRGYVLGAVHICQAAFPEG